MRSRERRRTEGPGPCATPRASSRLTRALRSPWTRRGRRISTAIAAALLAACSARPAASPAYESDGEWIDAAHPTPRAAPPPRVAERWDLDAHLGRLRPASARRKSQHYGGDAEGEILASPESGYPLRGPTSVAPAGATVVERVFLPSQSTAAVYFVMVKHPRGFDPPGGDWEYLVVTPDSRIEARGSERSPQPSPVGPCARCHAEAPHDRLFGGAG